MIQNKTVMWLASCPNCDFPPPPLPSHSCFFYKLGSRIFTHQDKVFFKILDLKYPSSKHFCFFSELIENSEWFCFAKLCDRQFSIPRQPLN